MSPGNLSRPLKRKCIHAEAYKKHQLGSWRLTQLRQNLFHVPYILPTAPLTALCVRLLYCSRKAILCTVP